jgi:hypothetical protein
MIDKLYNGTIFEGKLATSKKYNIYTIIDSYYFCGSNVLKIHLTEKINLIKKFFNDIIIKMPIININTFLNYLNNYSINSNSIKNNFSNDTNNKKSYNFNDYLDIFKKYNDGVYDIMIAKYDTKENLSNFIFDMIKNSEYNINGLVFMPVLSDIFYIYSNKNQFVKSKYNL